MIISFLGDISFNNEYIKLRHNGYNPFSNLMFLKDSDFVIGNLECLSCGDEGENILKNPRLKTTTDTLEWLKYLNVTHVSLANNHVYDNLNDGFKKTTEKLDELGINYWGACLGSTEQKYIELKEGDFVVGVLTYLDSDTNPCKPVDTDINVSFLNSMRIEEDIKFYKKKCDILILYLHWGGKSENLAFPEKKQIIYSREFHKCGANFIIGHHSHTIQPITTNSFGTTLYSLGNFCFSDIETTGENIKLSETNKEGIIFTLEIDGKSKLTTKQIYIEKKLNCEVVVRNKKLYSHKIKNVFFNSVITFMPSLTNIPIVFNKYFHKPLSYVLRGNPINQLRNLDKTKIMRYLK